VLTWQNEDICTLPTMVTPVVRFQSEARTQYSESSEQRFLDGTGGNGPTASGTLLSFIVAMLFMFTNFFFSMEQMLPLTMPPAPMSVLMEVCITVYV